MAKACPVRVATVRSSLSLAIKRPMAHAFTITTNTELSGGTGSGLIDVPFASGFRELGWENAAFRLFQISPARTPQAVATYGGGRKFKYKPTFQLRAGLARSYFRMRRAAYISTDYRLPGGRAGGPSPRQSTALPALRGGFPPVRLPCGYWRPAKGTPRPPASAARRRCRRCW